MSVAAILFLSAVLYAEDTAKEACDKGVQYASGGDMDGAIAMFGKAIEMDPSYGKAYFDRGNAYDAKIGRAHV